MRKYQFIKIPQLESETLKFIGALDCGNGNIQYAFDNATQEDAERYGEKLLEADFELCAKNEIGDSRFATYESREADVRVYVSFFSGRNTLRIIKGRKVEKVNEKALSFLCPNDIKGDTVPTLTHMPLVSTGLLIVLQLCDKSFVIVDGGLNAQEDRERLYEYLVSKLPSGEKPRISWFITHGHVDHIRLATGFLEQYAENVELSCVFSNFPDFEKLCLSREAPEGTMGHIASLGALLKEKYPNTAVYTYHTGEKFYFPECEVEVIETFEDLYPNEYSWVNDTSSAYRITLCGRSIIVFGDCTTKMNDLAVESFGEYLKSDIMQVPHHGAGCASYELYKTVDAQICLWAVSGVKFAGDERMLGTNKHMTYNAWLRDDANGKREHYHQSELTEINLADMTVRKESVY